MGRAGGVVPRRAESRSSNRFGVAGVRAQRAIAQPHPFDRSRSPRQLTRCQLHRCLLVGTSGDELLVVHATKFTIEHREATDGGIIAIAPLLDGTFITACHDGQLARWSRDATTHDRNPRLPIDSVWDFVIATDGTTFAAAGSNGAAWFGDLRFLADASMIRMDSGITSCAFPTKGSEVTFAGAAGLYFCQPVIGAS